MTTLKAPELLSPAGTLKSMRYAFAYGADAVYAGQPRYSLRVRNNEFDLDNLKVGIDEAHGQGKKFLVASNIAPHNTKIKTYLKDIEPVIDAGPDALIMSDPGLIAMVRKHFPEMEIHLSVQANVVNYATAHFWQAQGIKRIILSRELGIKEIEEMRTLCPDIELEVFVHGALCMAYSGRCLLSGYINKRDANQGSCTNACRWKYDVKESKVDSFGEHPPTTGCGSTTTREFEVREQKKPDQAMTISEDEHGTYIFNSKDLRAIHHVEKLTQIGLDCVKIEGRTKSHFYVARTAQLYRQAIDDAVAGRPFNIALMDELEGLANRGYTEGLLRRHVHDEYQNYETGNSIVDKQQFAGEISDIDANGMATIIVKNKFSVGDTLQIIRPSGNYRMQLDGMETDKGVATEVAPGSGHIVKIPLHDTKDCELGLITRIIPQTADTAAPVATPG